ncbi:hypothetical protein ACF3DV_16510 [Chlorogloeopsis fritschii PCC 9212]|uniref:hypothetical protein n=1 Tax=Chlorogloeopsis fritschii TaxID=1124 RepID=UPI000F8EFE7E|nr:hypothetical protein [Chlorogloeopsis fritschii]
MTIYLKHCQTTLFYGLPVFYFVYSGNSLVKCFYEVQGTSLFELPALTENFDEYEKFLLAAMNPTSRGIG